MPQSLVVPPVAARRFLRHALGLDQPFADLSAALAHLGYVQIDPINVAGRMHDLILRLRVRGYREGDLTRFLHDAGKSKSAAAPQAAARRAFEHHLPDTGVLVAFPLEAWPHLLAAMHARSRHRSHWSGRLTPRERALAETILAEIAARGPLGSEDFDDPRRTRRPVWGSATLVKNALQKLFFHGRLLIAQRANNRRRYDLPERVLPAATLAQPEPTAADTARWLALLKLRQRRLVTLKRAELGAVADAVQPVTIAGCPPLFCLREDAPQLAAECSRPARPASARQPIVLLAPLDPLLYDRRVTAALWDFNYTWEAYTPAHKRVRGHYALPILAGTELVGHVDPKADRTAGRLTIVSQQVRRGYSASAATRELAVFLGLKK